MKNKIKIVFFSDTNGFHRKLGYGDFIDADIAVFCGNMCESFVKMNQEIEVKNFIQWFSGMPVAHKVLIAGSNDFTLGGIEPFMDSFTDIHYLFNSGCVIEGINFWGSPLTRPIKRRNHIVIQILGTPINKPDLHRHYFNDPDEVRQRNWKLIPENTDILITHTPPKGFLDTWYDGGEHYGCEFLTEEITKREHKPKIIAFGYILGGYGEAEIDSVKLINCSVVNEQYELVNKPITVEL